MHTNVKKETFEYLLKLTSMQLVSILFCKCDIEIYYSHTVLFCETATCCMYNYLQYTMHDSVDINVYQV